MIDRIVRQLVPQPAEPNQRRLFSEYAETPNIVLLGAPGAGKTHLFIETAAKNGMRVTTRDFLNIPTLPAATTLFIDALDERRAGRGDQSTIDAVVQKLFDVQPKQLRISCRESDWLGSTDLATFQPYFNSHGGYVVLALEKLTEEEQRAVLQMQGVTNPNEFLEQAAERGLNDLLESSLLSRARKWDIVPTDQRACNPPLSCNGGSSRRAYHFSKDQIVGSRQRVDCAQAANTNANLDALETVSGCSPEIGKRGCNHVPNSAGTRYLLMALSY
ncbi:hypothetical protein CI1B_58330 [Bradyrhizobium ivorense]|uniref:Uncharacterized protein n=1 Tax=Bradyrhizobium ivorense TaxID=2511166 RepID=A0A508TM56_9BRAD|nr:hypothetical protein [Bradyrhizobium ivorense]VIO75331.1 hypothetical protein CI1B_58330 [Bradyrhizobium ivorense]